MMLTRSSESALGVVITAVAAFVAVAPCPLAKIPTAVIAACFLALISALVVRSAPLAVGVTLAYVSFALQTKLCKRQETFTVHVPDEEQGERDTRPEPASYTPLEPAVAKVTNTMTRERLQALIRPEHLEAAQSNAVP